MQGTGNTFSETRTCIFFPVPHCCSSTGITLELSLRMEGSGSAWQNPFPVSRRNQKIQPWEPAPKASTGFGSLCWDSLLWWVENHLPYLHFFHDIFNFLYPTWTKIFKLFRTAKDFTSSFLLSSKTGGQGTEAKGKRRRG